MLALNGGDKDEVAELSQIAHDKLSLSQQTWLPLMLETAAFLRGFNKLQVEELLAAKDKPAFGMSVLILYGRFFAKAGPALLASRRIGTAPSASKTGEFYFRASPVVVHAYTELMVAMFGLIPNPLWGEADENELDSFAAALDQAATVLGDGMFWFGKVQTYYYRGQFDRAADLFAKSADHPSIAITTLTAQMFELDALARLRMAKSLGEQKQPELIKRVEALIGTVLRSATLEEGYYPFLVDVAYSVSAKSVMIAIAAQWRLRYPDSKRAKTLLSNLSRRMK